MQLYPNLNTYIATGDGCVSAHWPFPYDSWLSLSSCRTVNPQIAVHDFHVRPVELVAGVIAEQLPVDASLVAVVIHELQLLRVRRQVRLGQA